MLKKFLNSLKGIKEDAEIKDNIETEKEDHIEENETAEDAENSLKDDIETVEEDIEIIEEEIVEIEEETDNIEEDIQQIEEDIEDLMESNIEKKDLIVEADSISEIESSISLQTMDDEQENQVTRDVEVEQAIVDQDIFEEKKAPGLFARLKQGLEKTTQNITGRLDELFKGHIEIDDDLYEEIEEILITGDVGFETTLKIIENLKANIKKKSIQNTSQVRDELKNVIEELLTLENGSLNVENPPVILVIIGVNGVGKTTSIGKLALRLKNEGKSVLLAAADTFRAAAAEQLEVWAKRAEVDIVMHQEGSDPSAVIFDAIKSAKSKKTDVLICDTAGRLHNKKNLMQELSKIFRIIDREYPEASKEVLIVIDATTGQNAISQVKLFKEAAPVTGVILTKLDGTAKGGVVLSIASEQQLPIKLIGVGEKIEDLQDFDPKDFAEALFSKLD